MRERPAKENDVGERVLAAAKLVRSQGTRASRYHAKRILPGPNAVPALICRRHVSKP